MENNAKQNQDLNYFPKDPNQALYGENNPPSNEKNKEQEGFTDDSGFGHNTINPEPNPDESNPDKPNPDEPSQDDAPDYEENDEDDGDLEKDEDIEEENPDDDDYPGEDENPDEKKKYYLSTNGKKYAVFFDLNLF